MAVTLPTATHTKSPWMSPWTHDHTAMHRILSIDLDANDNSLVIDGSGNLNNKLKVTNITAAYTVLSGDMGGLARCYGSMTVTLPPASGVIGRRLDAIQLSGAGSAVFERASVDLINGATSVNLSSQYATVCIVASDLSTWNKI